MRGKPRCEWRSMRGEQGSRPGERGSTPGKRSQPPGSRGSMPGRTTGVPWEWTADDEPCAGRLWIVQRDAVKYGGRLGMLVGRKSAENKRLNVGALPSDRQGEETDDVPAARTARNVGRGTPLGHRGRQAAKLSLESLEAGRVRREDRPARREARLVCFEARPTIFEARRRVRAAVRSFQGARIIAPSDRRRVRAAGTERSDAGITIFAARPRVRAPGVTCKGGLS
jgi:hypothetical protein